MVYTYTPLKRTGFLLPSFTLRWCAGTIAGKGGKAEREGLRYLLDDILLSYEVSLGGNKKRCGISVST